MPWYRRFTRWLLRRQPRLVCIHMKAGEASVTGYLVGRWSGHYVLELAKLLETEKSSVPMGHVEIPVGNVFCVQALVAAAS